MPFLTLPRCKEPRSVALVRVVPLEGRNRKVRGVDPADDVAAFVLRVVEEGIRDLADQIVAGLGPAAAGDVIVEGPGARRQRSR